MAQYGKVEGGVITKVGNKDNPATEIGGDGEPIWRPITSTPQPAYDGATQHAPVEEQGINVGKAIINNGPTIVQTWFAAVAKTAQELDDEKTSKATSINNSDLGNALKLTMTAQFNQENRIRALESKAPITVDQYFDGIDALPTITDQEFIDRLKDLMS